MLILQEAPAGATKGIEYIIAIVGLITFLFFLNLLKPPEDENRPAETDH